MPTSGPRPALRNSQGNNTWSGPVTLDDKPGFAALSYPDGAVSFGVDNPQDTLTISGDIDHRVALALATLILGSEP